MNRVALLIAIAGAIAPATLAQQPPTTAPAKIPAGSQPAPGAEAKAKAARKPIYDEQADAKQQIAAALTKARKENTRVLIQWGGNWCGWCHLLHDAFKTDTLRIPSYEYELVLIDAGKDQKNVDLAASYGAELTKHGYPYLTILDASGKAIANQETESLELKGDDGKSIGGAGAGHDPARVAAFLKEHEPAHLQADAVLSDAIGRAKASGKLVFVHFGAPWCGWCHRLEDWLARPDVAPLIAKEFVEVKIDQDRMVGAKEVQSRVEMPEKSGIPWFVFLDPTTGKGVANSTGTDPKTGKPANIGFPAADHEIEHFMGMLDKTRKNLSAADVARLKETLLDEQKKTARR